MSEIDPSQLEGDMVPQGRYKPARELDSLHENTDLDVRGVLFNTVVLVALCGSTFFIVKLVMDHFVGVEKEIDQTKLSLRFPDAPPPPEPVLQSDPAKETTDAILQAKARLDSYGWVDRGAKTAHIPIERAISILAEKGLPDRGVVDQFHPQQGSSNPQMIGLPGEKKAAGPGPNAESAPTADAGSKP